MSAIIFDGYLASSRLNIPINTSLGPIRKCYLVALLHGTNL